MRAPTPARALSFVVVALLPACGALLDLPDPSVDDGYGKTDSGFYPDGAPIGDGNTGGDGTTGSDGQSGGDGSSGDGSSGGDSGLLNCGAAKCPVGNVTAPNVLANDGTYIYAISGADKIVRFNPRVGPSASVLTTTANTLKQLYVSGSNFFFTAQGTGTGTVTRCATTGCADGRTDYVTGSDPYFGVVADGTNVYYGVQTSGTDKGLFSCTISGTCGGSAFLGFSNPRHMLIDPAASPSRLFWDDTSGNGVYECNAGSCTSGADNVGSFMVDIAAGATETYWAGTTTIHHHQRGTGAADATIADNGSSHNVAIDQDLGDVYWLDKNDGTNGFLWKCPAGVDCTLGGSPPMQLASGIADATDMTIMGGYVYVGSAVDNKVYAIAE